MDNIANIDGKDAMAYTGAKPWHRLGTKIPGLMTVEEAIMAGGLDWQVEKRQLMTADAEMVPIPNVYAIGRVGPETNYDGSLKFIPFESTVKGRYTIIQNMEAFDFFNNALKEGAACIETVAALGNGEVVFAMAKIPDNFEPIAGDPIERYILLTTGHDGSSSIEATFTPIRVVCWNTLNAALKGSKNKVKIRHTKSAKARLDQAHKVLASSEKYWEELGEAYKALAMYDMTRLDVIQYIADLFPGKKKKIVDNSGVVKEVEEVSTRTMNNRDKIIELFEGGAIGSNSKIAGSAYQMYQAVTQYIDLERSVRKTSDRWEASVFGSGQLLRQKAFDGLTALV